MKNGKMTVKNILKIAWILYAVFSIIIWLPKVDQMLTNDYSQVKSYVSLDDAWDVTIGEETFGNVSLDRFRFPAVKKGETIVMQRELPQ